MTVMMLTCGGMLQWARAKASFPDFTSSRLIAQLHAPILPTRKTRVGFA